MLFQSSKFVVFLLCVFFLYWKTPHKYRCPILLAAGYLFYLSHSFKYTFLLFGITVFSYLFGVLIDITSDSRRKGLLIVYVFLELGLLVIFKYLGFFSEIIQNLINSFGNSVNIPIFKLALPIGISFYIFQTMAYVFDIYYRKITAEKHFGYFAVSIAFFPILLAGPIERIQKLIFQFKQEKIFSYEEAKEGFQRIIFGLIKKIILADGIAIYVNQVYKDIQSYSGFILLVVILAYSFQIYFDFSGYSDIAIGIASLLGIRLSANFQYPYFADSIKDFWKRWHISLTSWFRDYVYIPLGGNRAGIYKRDRNIFIVFLLSGLWHGANWTFLVWGVLHGMMQIIENRLTKFTDKLFVPKVIRQITVFILISMAWVFFRADTVLEAVYILGHCMDGILSPLAYFNTPNLLLGMPTMQLLFLLVFLMYICFMEYKKESGKEIKVNNIHMIFVMEIALIYYLKYGTDGSAFIYAQF